MPELPKRPQSNLNAVKCKNKLQPYLCLSTMQGIMEIKHHAFLIFEWVQDHFGVGDK
jgi:hypothetical protein